MDEKKQIEEMAHDMCGNFMSNGNCATDDEPCNLECVYGWCVERLYCKGYRKQSEGEWLHGVYNENCIAPYEHICSCCEKSYFDTWYEHRYPYCPNCGARMEAKNQ